METLYEFNGNQLRYTDNGFYGLSVELNDKKQNQKSGGFREVFIFDDFVVKFDAGKLDLNYLNGTNQSTCEAIIYESVKTHYPLYLDYLLEPVAYQLATKETKGFVIQPFVKIDFGLIEIAVSEDGWQFEAFKEAIQEMKLEWDIDFYGYNNMAYTKERGFFTYDYGNVYKESTWENQLKRSLSGH